MEQKVKLALAESMQHFRLPRFDEIPDVGLYLEQTTKYIAGYLEPLEGVSITTSMVSNYVKQGLVGKPVKKQYNRVQIAYLIFIAVAKTVLSLEDIQILIEQQKRSYDERTAYEYFCEAFERLLLYVFGLRDTVEDVGVDSTDEKVLLRNTIITIAHKIYLKKCLALLCEDKQNDPKNAKKKL